jgi:hypothetical protein
MAEFRIPLRGNGDGSLCLFQAQYLWAGIRGDWFDADAVATYGVWLGEVNGANIAYFNALSPLYIHAADKAYADATALLDRDYVNNWWWWAELPGQSQGFTDQACPNGIFVQGVQLLADFLLIIYCIKLRLTILEEGIIDKSWTFH